MPKGSVRIADNGLKPIYLVIVAGVQLTVLFPVTSRGSFLALSTVLITII